MSSYKTIWPQAINKPQIRGNQSFEYLLAFPESYEGHIKWKYGEYDKMISSERESFLQQINTYALQNYKIHSSDLSAPLAILKFDESQFEYDWFETVSSVHFVKHGLAAKLAEAGEKGFQVIEHAPISQSCEFLDSQEPAFGEKCVYKDLFLIEKEMDSKRRIEQIVAGSVPGWRNQPSKEIESEIEAKLEEGFYPIKPISKFEVLLERAKNMEDISESKPDVKIVRSAWGTSNVRSKINELGKQGYRLATVSDGIAILYKNEETSKSTVSYVWLQADKKSFAKELQKLQEAGAHYVTYDPDKAGRRNTLIFEQYFDGKRPRNEFRILTFEFVEKEHPMEKMVHRELTLSSVENVKIMNELAREGFIIGDLFDSGKASVILERRMQ